MTMQKNGRRFFEYYTKLATAHTEDKPMIIEHLHSDEEYIESVRYIQNRLGL